jgi:hypothetical protein
MRECFIPRRFEAEAAATIDQINNIIEEYQAQGFTLTLRQLFYQFGRAACGQTSRRRTPISAMCWGTPATQVSSIGKFRGPHARDPAMVNVG